MDKNASPGDREGLRRWLENWRAVNRAQDELVRVVPPPAPAVSLAAGLSMIDLALRLGGRRPQVEEVEWRQRRETESVQRTWIRLRAAHGR